MPEQLLLKLPEIPQHVQIDLKTVEYLDEEVAVFEVRIPVEKLRDWYQSVPNKGEFDLGDQIADALTEETSLRFDFGAEAKVGDIVDIECITTGRFFTGMEVLSVNDYSIQVRDPNVERSITESFMFQRDSIVISYAEALDNEAEAL